MEKETSNQRILKGIPASEGVVIGKAFVLEREADLFIPLKKIKKEEIKKEVHKYKIALETTKRELEVAKEHIVKSLGKHHAGIADIYINILDDQILTREVNKIIEEEQVAAEYALSCVLHRIIQSFEQIEDEYFRARSSDIRDVGRKLLRNLLGKGRKEITQVSSEHIVIAHTLSPSDAIVLKERNCGGFVMDIGGRTSHVVLVAQGLQLTAIVGLKNVTEIVRDDETVIIDGFEGFVIISPDEETINQYKSKQEALIKEREYLIILKDLPAETVDGHRVKIACNLDTHTNIDEVLSVKSEGIGLFRTEYLYLDRTTLPTEEELFKVYNYVAEKIYPYHVVFRTLDLGGDKLSQLGLEGIRRESSPALGLRGIRLSLKYKDIFKTQLRAILRASKNRNVKIMFPMVSSITEFIEAKKVVKEVMTELKEKNIEFDPELPLGVMIELPSVALTSDIIAKEADFLSIGSNDLVQYTLGVDRTNENVADLYEPLHLSVLRLIKHVIDSAHSKGKPVAICGEIASDIAFTKLLIGMGIDELSVLPGVVLKLKNVIRNMSIVDARNLVKEVFATDDRDIVIQILENERLSSEKNSLL